MGSVVSESSPPDGVDLSRSERDRPVTACICCPDSRLDKAQGRKGYGVMSGQHSCMSVKCKYRNQIEWWRSCVSFRQGAALRLFAYAHTPQVNEAGPSLQDREVDIKSPWGAGVPTSMKKRNRSSCSDAAFAKKKEFKKHQVASAPPPVELGRGDLVVRRNLARGLGKVGASGKRRHPLRRPAADRV